MAGTETTTAAPTPPISTPDWLKVSGYAAVAYTYSDYENGGSNETLFDGRTLRSMR